MTTFLEEAKSMLEIEDYHENIINLQGIIYGKEDVAKGTPKVSPNTNTNLFLESWHLNNNKLKLMTNNYFFKFT